ncbi:MAG: DUF58 domain-containing protein [Planctomycetota bacterium]
MATAVATSNAVDSEDRLRLDPAFLAKLDKLDVHSRKILQGKMKGERRSKRRGQSVEFADFRNYVPGDDLRFIDWNAYARLDKLFLKLFLEEEDLALSVLVDVSKSTDYGDPHKLGYLRRVAAALGYVGLVNYNRVSVSAYADGVVADTGGLRGRRSVPRLLDFLDQQKPTGSGDLAKACRDFALRHRNKGVVVLLGDLFDKAGFEEGLRYLLAGRYDVFVVQVLSPQELEPDMKGDLKLIDLEDDDAAEVSITAPLLRRYKANLDGYCRKVRDYVTRRGGSYLLATTDTPFDELVLTQLRSRGLLR